MNLSKTHPADKTIPPVTECNVDIQSSLWLQLKELRGRPGIEHAHQKQDAFHIKSERQFCSTCPVDYQNCVDCKVHPKLYAVHSPVKIVKAHGDAVSLHRVVLSHAPALLHQT